MVLALDGAGHAVMQGHRDKACTGVDTVQQKWEGHCIRLPVSRVGTEIATHLPKSLHALGKHVVAMDLGDRWVRRVTWKPSYTQIFKELAGSLVLPEFYLVPLGHVQLGLLEQTVAPGQNNPSRAMALG